MNLENIRVAIVLYCRPTLNCTFRLSMENVTIVTGEYNLQAKDASEIEFSVWNITWHPDFNKTTLYTLQIGH